MTVKSASRRASEAGSRSEQVAVWAPSSPRRATAASIAAICGCTWGAAFLSHAPTMPAAVASCSCASRSSPVSRSTLLRAESTSDSLASSASARPSLQRRHDSANATGHESSRLPRISMAKLPARRRLRSPAAIHERIAARNSSNASVSAASSAESTSGRACGSRRVQNLGGLVRSLISDFRRRITTCCTRPRSAGLSSSVALKRTGSSSSSRPVKLRVWPLCGVAERNSRCSKRGAMRRSILVRSLSSPNGDGIRL